MVLIATVFYAALAAALAVEAVLAVRRRRVIDNAWSWVGIVTAGVFVVRLLVESIGHGDVARKVAATVLAVAYAACQVIEIVNRQRRRHSTARPATVAQA